jgi:AcrR family transcriptional regulator
MAKKTPIETREKLVQAAAQLVMANGINRVTLEQVALHAGVSKGGLLHHFPTKRALLNGLIEGIGRVFEQRLEKYLALETPGFPGRFARAYIRASFEYETDELRLTNAISKVVGEFPELLQELQADFLKLDQEMQSDGLPAARALVIRMACDGLWFSELMGISKLQDSLRSQMLEELMMLTRSEQATLEPATVKGTR